MDTSTIIIAAILLAICVLPFILISRSRRKKEVELLQLLNDIAKNMQCNINEHELCCNMMIGLDGSTNTLFFINKSDTLAEVKHMKLNDYKECEFEKKVRSTGESSVIESLVLKFIPANDQVKAVYLEFYNAGERFQLNGELQLMEKWHKIIVNKLEQ